MTVLSSKRAVKRSKNDVPSLKFEGARLDSFFEVLDALAWLNLPTIAQVSQFAGIDSRTGGKLLRNGLTIGLVESLGNDRYSLLVAYPHKGGLEQKKAVVREALVRLPLLKNVRQFLKLGESLDNALRKAAAVQKMQNFDPKALTPLLDWAKQFNALDPSLDVEELLDKAEVAKQERHLSEAEKRVVFLSHSSKDKPIIRQLATDLTAAGITVWLDEQKIHVGDSIPEGIAQGLAGSDFFLIALSESSVSSEWVKRELNAALIEAVSKRKVKVLPVLLSPTEIPAIIRDMKYADFTKSYKNGLSELLAAILANREDKNGRN